jgi:N-acyl-L-homoserine lactone synthetase
MIRKNCARVALTINRATIEWARAMGYKSLSIFCKDAIEAYIVTAGQQAIQAGSQNGGRNGKQNG